MWGLGILVLLSIYIGLMIALIRRIESRTIKILIIISALALPSALPFLHLASPIRYQFESLCTAKDREVIYQVKPIDYIYLGESSMCTDGYKYLKSYNGIECEWAPKENKEPGNNKGMFRYIKGPNWSSAQCGETCLKKASFFQKEECQISCMKKVGIEKFSHPFSYKSENREIVKNKLYLHESSLMEEGEVMAKFKNYTYYPYGNTWAKILGASSGSAPAENCATRTFVQNTDVYKPSAP
jgi:hypothetical protein